MSGDEPLESLREEADEPPRESVEIPVSATVLPSLEDQMDASGTGDIDMRMQVGEFSHPDTGEQLGEVMVGMSGKVWVEFDEGERVAFTLTELVEASMDAVHESEIGPDYVEEADE